VAVEKLAVANMTSRPQPKRDPVNEGQYLRNGARAKAGLNKALQDAALGRIRRQMEYKLQRRGGVLVEVNRFYPSSKTCSRCSTVKAKLPLSTRVFRCDNEACGLVMDRDENAARNLLQLAREIASPDTSVSRVEVAASGAETLNGRGADTGLLRRPSATKPCGAEKRQAGSVRHADRTGTVEARTGSVEFVSAI